MGDLIRGMVLGLKSFDSGYLFLNLDLLLAIVDHPCYRAVAELLLSLVLYLLFVIFEQIQFWM